MINNMDKIVENTKKAMASREDEAFQLALSRALDMLGFSITDVISLDDSENEWIGAAEGTVATYSW